MSGKSTEEKVLWHLFNSLRSSPQEMQQDTTEATREWAERIHAAGRDGMEPVAMAMNEVRSGGRGQLL